MGLKSGVLSAERRLEKGAACIVMSADGKVVCMGAQTCGPTSTKWMKKWGRKKKSLMD